jgi:hypothetical protein
MSTDCRRLNPPERTFEGLTGFDFRRLGIVFVENGAGSFYATEALARQLPADSAPTTEALSTTTEPLPTKSGVSAA